MNTVHHSMFCMHLYASSASNEYSCKYVAMFSTFIKANITENDAFKWLYIQFYGHPHFVVYAANEQLNNNHSLQSILHFSFILQFD